MLIAVASGKGGTGKTTVATNMAYSAALAGRAVTYVDCDVEEPNGHLFLGPRSLEVSPVTRPVPHVDEARCTHCGLCGEICQYSAIVPLPKAVLVCAELCHACGGCVLACPVDAITERPHLVGTLETGQAGPLQFVRGVLNVGEASSPPLIRAVKLAVARANLTIVDCPPGTSCPVIEAVRGSDFVLLVTEPTPFGLHDLELAVEMVRALGLPVGVLINRCDQEDGPTVEYCRVNRLKILARIPDDRRIAEAYSRGQLICTALPEYRATFEALLAGVARSAESVRSSAVAAGGRP